MFFAKSISLPWILSLSLTPCHQGGEEGRSGSEDQAVGGECLPVLAHQPAVHQLPGLPQLPGGPA